MCSSLESNGLESSVLEGSGLESSVLEGSGLQGCVLESSGPDLSVSDINVTESSSVIAGSIIERSPRTFLIS